MTLVRKTSLVDMIYDELRQSIISLEISPGARINVNELQDTYGVSTTPIREAVNRLQREGLILYENNVGARVITMDEHDAWEIDELAITLHGAAIRFSLGRGNLFRIAEELQEHLLAHQRSETEREAVESICKFIGVFYRYSGNSRLHFNMKLIQGQQLMLRYIYRKEVGLEIKHLDVLSAIYQAARVGDSGEAERQIRELSDRAMPVVLEAVRRMNGN
ncbi:MAG: GntR family transcriptional regulator [Lachnospiraceae bacterium]|nr:GntR family transcriptional regulator [Lachnospiraceae bacterium]